jgi:hypothetical protein
MNVTEGAIGSAEGKRGIRVMYGRFCREKRRKRKFVRFKETSMGWGEKACNKAVEVDLLVWVACLARSP